MEYTRMSTEDMLQYCDEALAWEEFGAVDIFFFESVKRILLGQCPDVMLQPQDEMITSHVTDVITDSDRKDEN